MDRFIHALGRGVAPLSPAGGSAEPGRPFRQDVVRVARNRGPGGTVEQVAADFGVHSITLSK